MRSMTTMAAVLLLGTPLVTGGPPAKADNNDFMGQRFLNGSSGNDRDAYQRGRNDEMRRQQAEGNGYRHRHEYNQNWRLGQRYYAPDDGRDM
jgi:hypothetical protein